VTGLDVSAYAIEHAKEEVRDRLRVGNATALPFGDASFDLVVSLGTLHNLALGDLWQALEEIERVGRGAKYVMVESYRDQREKVNLLYWQLTCKSFYSVEDWEWLYRRAAIEGTMVSSSYLIPGRRSPTSRRSARRSRDSNGR